MPAGFLRASRPDARRSSPKFAFRSRRRLGRGKAGQPGAAVVDLFGYGEPHFDESSGSRTLSHAFGASSGKPPPPASLGSADTGASARLGPLKILVVEDESVIAWALQSLLEDMGHVVVDVVSSGRAAIAAAADLQPELIFMDINLGPGPDGIEAAEQIRSDSSATVIFVSAYGDPATHARVEDAVPGSLLLTKQVSAQAIHSAIAKAISHH